MGLDYHIYNTKTGELISDDRWAGMPFLSQEASPYVHDCVVKGDLWHIDEWTIDKESEIYKEEMNKDHWYRDDDVILYCSKDDILNLQKLMKVNEMLLEELMTEHNSDGLIIRIF